MTTVYARILIAAILVFGGTAAVQAGEASGLRAGAAKSNATPWLGVSIAGHMSDRIATHIHDELHARCLVLDNGQTKAAIALVDSCMVPRDVFDAAKAEAAQHTGIPAAHMVMAATHTHTGPCSTPVFQSDPDEEYKRFLASRIADGIRRADNNLQPARFARGSCRVPGEVFNRRWYMKAGTVPPNPFGDTSDTVKMNPPRASEGLIKPEGPTDPEVAFLAFETPEGKPIALLANYSLHYVGGAGGGHISADYFGYFARYMEKMLNAADCQAPFVAMLSNGTSGNINNIDFTKQSERKAQYEQMRHVARKVAEAVHAAYPGLNWQDAAVLDAAQREISLGVRLPAPGEVEEAKAVVAAAEGPQMRGLKEIYARETVLLSAYPDTVDLILQVLRVGDTAIAAIPCEVFVEIGLAIKEATPLKDAFTISLANGYNGYLPTAEAHTHGGYETWRARSSYLEEQAANKMLNVIRELMARVN